MWHAATGATFINNYAYIVDYKLLARWCTAIGGLMQTSEANGQQGRILLVDDDLALGGYLSRVLRSGGFDVAHELDAPAALFRVEAEQWDLLITDIELPGMNGLELLERVSEKVPELPVAVLTGHPSVDYAVTALRGSAAEFLSKPVSAADLLAKATELIESGRAARDAGREKVLAIGAHPDDVEIGAGGTLAAHGAVGDAVSILTLSRGAIGGDKAQRAREARESADIIGARLFLMDLEDTHIPEGNPTIGLIEEVIAQTQPTIVYTHSLHDLHQDHRNIHRAAMVACRGVGRVFCYQSPSATVDYRPTYFVTIDDYLSRKLKVIDAFSTQASIRDYMEPELITSTARYWARYSAGTHAEPFETIRDRAGPEATL
jgi:LmbE family N-acetylglucosaminyl deacetylase/ActR/RegA family two-component response regulator